MPHFRVDDGLDSHPKAQRAGDEALGMWVRAGSWCMRYLTDGFVPDWWVKQQPKGLAKAKKLVAAGLWNDGVVHDGEKGYRFHEFTGPGRQDSREQIEADRDKWRQKKQRQRGEASSMSPGDRSGDTPRDKAGDTRESPGYTQPNPTLKNSGEPKSVSPDSTASEPRSAPVTPAANRLVSEHIPATHPAAVRTELRLQASALLKDGQSEELVGAALALWTTKSLHPKTLPSLVSELINGRNQPARNTSEHAKAPPAARKVGIGLDLAREFANQPEQPALEA
ncbi:MULTISPECIES: hypothetical protein [Mycobacteroides]|uniref:hypothetical protein n=1 Tax=Mycobacteroides TaxID=670516 RepID=UPI000991B47D|nr:MULTISPECIES: hypothetical protein [Mycobacteroides]MDB2211756.1 hypothetical protein [Mycobacteroides abscessus subsp. massiliense]MDB2235394.1 hypothetical protein [Mycobacteroides abscessus subsp. massiliense]WJJ55573.1 RepA-like replication initiator [Mycobacterium phage prophiT36-2a]SKR76864.1 Uncharacterised protein [Mycobacteroides abscessus subsp. abscessus]